MNMANIDFSDKMRPEIGTLFFMKTKAPGDTLQASFFGEQKASP